MKTPKEWLEIMQGSTFSCDDDYLAFINSVQQDARDSALREAEKTAAEWFMKREPTTGAWAHQEKEIRVAIRALRGKK